ncbi:phytanoyl-CoA dioxygenase family protein [Mycobacterium vicinigordonae]|uniref:Phytanoyl-CoA dioxygenase family protein n=1 Tax=Mycobacterium vicinigordonae TaxID=1719132 RepID=A0A7D6HZ67_9MYCO|nr:phytanoyl-CoA dioxygenase family protein [Mycobacterium vicinigordonae]QLL08435.1 phytanoyl-CoA dioxygenase family protein [Mycobacterium vicinigordonae]
MIGTVLAAQAECRDFWGGLCPDMSIEGEAIARPAAVGETDELFLELKREGYVQVPNALPESTIAPIRYAVSTLFQRGIPVAFAFVYDELWLAYQSFSRFLTAVLGEGYWALPDFWVWYVSPSENASGWGPHRDRVIPTVDDDNSPQTLSVWLPFTDAVPLNGCMYVLPAHLDDRFQERRWDGEGNNVVLRPQDVRALPATAGSLLAWNQAVLHWGGRGSRMATSPRISAAFEFQRSDCRPFNSPLLDPTRVPTFNERLGLIGKQVLQYRHMYPLSDEVADVASSLFERFMPGVPVPDAYPVPTGVAI